MTVDDHAIVMGIGEAINSPLLSKLPFWPNLA
jgi:transketolase C-terminal domain/subunit